MIFFLAGTLIATEESKGKRKGGYQTERKILHETGDISFRDRSFRTRQEYYTFILHINPIW